MPASLMGKHRDTNPIPLVAPRPGQPAVVAKPAGVPTEPFWELADAQEDPLRPPVWLWILLLTICVGAALVVGWIWGNAAGMAASKAEVSTVSVYTPAPETETVTVTPKSKAKKGVDKTVRITPPAIVRTVTADPAPAPTKTVTVTVTSPASPRPTKTEERCFEIGPAGELLDLPCPAPGG